MIFTVTLNPAVDKTALIPGFAAGRVNRLEGARLTPGGKGINVSRALLGLGVPSVAMGILGGATGRFIQNELVAARLEGDFLFTRRPTRTNLKILDPVNGWTTDINEPGEPVGEAVYARLLRKLEARITPGDVVVLSGKAPPGAPEGLYALWCACLKRLGAKVCVDAEGPLLSLAVRACPDAVKPNEEEFARLVGRPLNGVADVAREALSLCASGVGLVAVSLGERGALLAREGRALHAHGLKVQVVSTVGAGDATLAAVALGMSRGDTLVEMARSAVAAGACAVMGQSPGTLSLDTVTSLSEQVILEEVTP
jgi:1-phosphofructokinase